MFSRTGVNDYQFREGRAADAYMFCRNPTNKPGRPWCYTTDPNKVWEHCNVPECLGIGEDSLSNE